MKKTIVVMAAAMLFGFSTYSFGWDVGCTPGYWKQTQHFDSWVGYTTDQTLQSAFGCGGSTTLLEALNANGGGLYALERHAVAALLNSTAVSHYSYTTTQVTEKFCGALNNGDIIETVKNRFEAQNDGTCPLN